MTKEALNKIETFVKLALSEIADLHNQLKEQQIKQAEEKVKDKALEDALKKAADAMYSSDFIIDEEEKALFVKKAKEDSSYLAKIVERVCNASDVAYMGKTATVKSSNQSEDPVLRRAFGYDSSYNLLDE
jgi:hypothetical protein